MRAQEHTVMSYLAWAVFFVVAMVVVYSVFGNIRTATPTPMKQIVELLTSATQSYQSGIGREVCMEVYPGGELELSDSFVEKVTRVNGVHFVCFASGCDVRDGVMVLSGRTGTLCVEVNEGGVYLTWR